MLGKENFTRRLQSHAHTEHIFGISFVFPNVSKIVCVMNFVFFFLLKSLIPTVFQNSDQI